MSAGSDRAICVGVDRVAGKCLVQWPVPDGSGLQPEVIPVRWVGNDPPAPMTYVNVQQVASGSWVCAGTTANVELRLLEDWDTVQADSTNIVVNGSTVWQINSSAGTGRWGTVFGGAAQEWGTIIRQTPAVSGGWTGVYKSDVTTSTDAARGVAWWYETRCVVIDSATRSFAAGLGIPYATDPFSSTGAGFDTALVLSESAALSGQLRFRCTTASSATETPIGFTPTAGVPFIVHVMFLGGLWAAAWVVEATTAAQDLDTTVHGPFVVTSNVRTSAFSPGVFVKSHAAAAKSVYCDYVRVSSVHPVLHPSEVLSG